MSRVRHVPLPPKLRLQAPPEQALSKPWLLWVLANGLGHAAGVALMAIVIFVVSLFRGTEETTSGELGLQILSSAIIGLSIGITVGLAQGVVLRQYVPQIPIWEWVLLTSAGSIVAWVTGPLMIFLFLLNIPCVILVAGALSGACVGITQRWVLLKYVGEAKTWVWLNVLAGIVFVIGMIVFAPIWGTIRNVGVLYGSPEAIIAGEIFGGVLYGMVTAWALVRLIRFYPPHPRHEV